MRRIVYSATNPPPTARLSATNTSGPSPLTVNFDGSASTDPEGEALSFLWTFGDGATATTTSPTTSHTYAFGSFTASLRVQDARGAVSAPVTVAINSGNSPPTATINSAPSTFRVGETISVTGSATDAQDQSLPDAAFSWVVLRHHGSHTHPWTSGTGRTFTFTAPAPEDLVAATNSYLDVMLEVTDTSGAKGTASTPYRRWRCRWMRSMA